MIFERCVPWIAAIAIVLLFGMVGTADYEAEKRDAAMYCDNVKNNVWSDYKKTYKKYCE